MGQEYIDLRVLPRMSNRYGVTRCGSVYSLCNKYGPRKSPRILRPRLNNGYLEVTLRVDSAAFRCKVHRLIAEAYLGLDPNSNMVVHHKNSIRDDNRAENLEVCSVRQNAIYAEVSNRETYRLRRKSLEASP